MTTNWSRALPRPSLLLTAAAVAACAAPAFAAPAKAPSVRTPVVQRPTINVGEKRLALVKFEAAAPAWSPDGKQVAFVQRVGDGKSGNIWISSMAGALRQVTKTGMDGAPAWTADGRLVVARVNKDRFAFYVVNTANGAARLLVNGRTFPLAGRDKVPSAVTFSPDGTRMAFDLCKPGETFGESGRVAVMEIKTAKVTDLALPPKSIASHPSWSPDGRYVAYQRLPKNWFFNKTGDESYSQVWLTDMRTNEVRQVTTPEKEMNFISPAWSPTGEYLAVEKWLVSMKRESTRETWIVNPANTEAGAVLPSVKRNVEGVTWAPDGKHFTYITALSMNGKFWNEIRSGVVTAQQRTLAMKLPTTQSARTLSTVTPTP